MFAIICRRMLIRVPKRDAIFITAHFSSAVGGGDQSLTLSYLVDSCGLSEKAALSISKNLCIKSRANPDAVLDLLKKYEFTNAHISKLVSKWPLVLQCSPEKTLLPKLEFFRSIGVPDAVAAQKLSTYSLLLKRSLENHLIPSHDYLRRLVKSEKKVLGVFRRAPLAFAVGWPKVIPSKIAILREKGLSETFIATLVGKQPSLFMLFSGEKLKTFVDRAAKMGFDPSKSGFIGALQVFASMSESTLKHKMDVFRSCGWSEYEATSAFMRYPSCMTLSEEKIRGNIEFLGEELGFKAADVALRPVLLGLSLDCRIRPRSAVIKVLTAKGLLKKSISAATISTMMIIGEESFVKRYISAYEEDIPWLLDLYRGKLCLSETGFAQDLIPK